ncbi:DUF58 domain-containing protein [Haloarcula halophila]|uniref:DUF58 domain-containing protein n=1 Tax=Haloarcula TaxID=2237 RepID=UPI0023E42EB5|nr:DUF58 domain-containing protein [Halomicroarcula sp. DFY41]
MSERLNARGDIGIWVALVAGAVGVVTGNTAVFMVAVVGLVYAAYEAAASVPEPELTITRALAPETPLPGQEVEVTVTVRNDGLDYLPDVRIVDGVPDRLRVTEGSPRFGTTLDVDESASFTYTITARRGEHAFGETTVVCRNLTGGAEYRTTAEIETELDCSTDAERLDMPPQTLPQSGRVQADAAGEGVAFYAIREYQSSDPMSRIDWNRFARTNELATVEFQETKAASVVLLVDARHPIAAEPRAPNAVQYCTYAAERLATALLEEENHVGAAVFDSCAYLRPSADRVQARRVREFLLEEIGGSDGYRATAEGTDWSVSDMSGQRFFEGIDGIEQRYGVADGGNPIKTLKRSIPSEAQIVFCSPLLDDTAADVAKRFAAYGHAVTLVTPDVTGSETPGATLESLDRDDRVDDLRSAVRVVDWEPDQPLSKALLQAMEGWSA